MSFHDSPLQNAFIVFTCVDLAGRVWSLQVAPSKERTVLADCVDLASCENLFQGR